MSFKKSDSKIKSFVTEDEAQDINVERQKEWERVRQPDDPLECPDVEPRSLFEQLQEQKEKAQQDHDEKYNLKNMFRGIDNDEAAFLEFASKQQAEIDRRRFAVTAEVEEYRNEVAKLQTTVDPVPANDEKEKKKPSASPGKKRSQVELLAGCIKTKRKRSEADSSEEEKPGNKSAACLDKNPAGSSEEQEEDVSKEPCVEEKQEDSSSFENQRSDASEEPTVVHDPAYGYPAVGGYIPCLGVYSDSSDSESSSSDSDILPSLFSFSSKAK